MIHSDQNVSHYYITLYVVQHVIRYLYVHIPTMAVRKLTTLTANDVSAHQRPSSELFVSSITHRQPNLIIFTSRQQAKYWFCVKHFYWYSLNQQKIIWHKSNISPYDSLYTLCLPCPEAVTETHTKTDLFLCEHETQTPSHLIALTITQEEVIHNLFLNVWWQLYPLVKSTTDQQYDLCLSFGLSPLYLLKLKKNNSGI